MKNKTALIFGVSGQDGAYLSKFLLSKKYVIHGVSRSIVDHKFLSLKKIKIYDQINLHSASLTNFKDTFEIINRINPDEIYNLSGQSSVGYSFKNPVETFESITLGVTNILESLRLIASNARFYNASSSECFGDTKHSIANESTPFSPKSPYGIAKVAAHWQVVNYREGYGIFACSGILFNHESPLRSSKFVTRKIISTAVNISLGIEKNLILGDLSIYRDWGWAPDYVEAMWLMLQQEKPKDYVISTGQANKLEDFVKSVFSELDLDWEEYVEYSQQLYRPSEINYSCGDPSKANLELGWKTKTYLNDIIKLLVKDELKSRSDL